MKEQFFSWSTFFSRFFFCFVFTVFFTGSLLTSSISSSRIEKDRYTGRYCPQTSLHNSNKYQIEIQHSLIETISPTSITKSVMSFLCRGWTYKTIKRKYPFKYHNAKLFFFLDHSRYYSDFFNNNINVYNNRKMPNCTFFI